MLSCDDAPRSAAELRSRRLDNKVHEETERLEDELRDALHRGGDHGMATRCAIAFREPSFTLRQFLFYAPEAGFRVSLTLEEEK